MCSLSATEKLCSVLSRSDELKVKSEAFIVIIINTHNFSKNKWIKFKVSIYGYCGLMKSPIAFTVNPMRKSFHACSEKFSRMCGKVFTHVHKSFHASAEKFSRMFGKVFTHVRKSFHACIEKFSRNCEKVFM